MKTCEMVKWWTRITNTNPGKKRDIHKQKYNYSDTASKSIFGTGCKQRKQSCHLQSIHQLASSSGQCGSTLPLNIFPTQLIYILTLFFCFLVFYFEQFQIIALSITPKNGAKAISIQNLLRRGVRSGVQLSCTETRLQKCSQVVKKPF